MPHSSLIRPFPTLTEALFNRVTGRFSDQRRLATHRHALQAMGINDLSSLPPITVNGTVVCPPGLLRQRAGVTQTSGQTNFTAFRSRPARSGGAPTLVPFSGLGDVLSVRNLRRRTSRTIYHEYAYWAASEINIPDNTTVVLSADSKYLVLIAEKVAIGRNVTFTWDRGELPVPTTPSTPKTPEDRGGSSKLDGLDKRGRDGRNGDSGGKGWPGKDAPQLEIWTLELTGKPQVELMGQTGGDGGNGGSGGNGGRGGKGRTAIRQYTTILGKEIPIPGAWAQGPGHGGPGGKGGNGGRGGDGGDGGNGGRFCLYTTQASIDQLSDSFYIDVSGGTGGEHGEGGQEGKGGAGGAGGHHPGGGRNGSPGPRGFNGNDGSDGTNGQPGSNYDDAIKFRVIDRDDFQLHLLRPALFKITNAKTGRQYPRNLIPVSDRVLITGKSFSDTDKLLLGGEDCGATILNDQYLEFTLPDVAGEDLPLVLKQKDGTISNTLSLTVKAEITEVFNDEGKKASDPGTRFLPGRKVTVKGTGFTRQAKVQIGGTVLPLSSMDYVSKNEFTFRLYRPTGVAADATKREYVQMKVLQGSHQTTDSIQLELNTYQVVFFGDSIVWGQGLKEVNKFAFDVEEHLKTLALHRIGVYGTNYANSGATIGIGNANPGEGFHGEVPASEPTIFAQIERCERVAEDVRLIVMNGGINDVGLGNLLLGKFNLRNDLPAIFRDDMRSLLDKVGVKFPNAAIIVPGYFKIFSSKSDSALVTALVTVLNPQGALVLPATHVALKKLLEERSATFWEVAHENLQKAIDQLNADLGSTRAVFADPMFGDDNAMFTGNSSWVYGINAALEPLDRESLGGVALERRAHCSAAGQSGVDALTCQRASVGHPNLKGADAYALAITKAFDAEVDNITTLF